MNKSILISITLAFLLVIVSPNLKADEKLNNAVVTETNSDVVADAKAEINKLGNRVLEINEMDFELLEKTEKKELKKELRSINKELKAYSKSENPAIAEAAKNNRGGGLYISSGALIIILLLIIIL